MGGAFSRCEFLDSITLPDSITSIGEKAFWRCSGLTSITIPDHVTHIERETFSECKRLANVIIPEGVTNIGEQAFRWCTRLTSITIPNSVVSIGDGAFDECKNLTSITIPDNVTDISDSAFAGCRGLADGSGYIIVCGVLYSNKSNEEYSAIPTGVTRIGENALYGRRNITDITIPEGVTSIGSFAFAWCRELKRIMLPNSLTSIGDSAFAGCSGLSSITIPENVMHIGAEAFQDCDGLEEITLPSSQAKRLSVILPKSQNIVIHMEDITGISTRYRPGAAVGFAEDGRDCADKNGKKYCRYIRSYAAKLIGAAVEHPTLFRLMLREKLIDAKDMDMVSMTVQETGNAELIAALRDYRPFC